jgi:hypothetical protein
MLGFRLRAFAQARGLRALAPLLHRPAGDDRSQQQGASLKLNVVRKTGQVRVPKRPKLDSLTAIIDQIPAADRTAHSKQHHTSKLVFERLHTSLMHLYFGVPMHFVSGVDSRLADNRSA